MRLRIGMRWWLALAFAASAALTAVTVAAVLSTRAERAFREHAEGIAVGNSITAARAVQAALERGELDRAVEEIGARRRLALFVFDYDGNLLTPRRSQRMQLDSIPRRQEALLAAFRGDSFVATFDNGRATLVAVPLSSFEAAALLAYAPRPDLAAGLGIAREKITQTALSAALAGAVAGLLVAAIITARLRRIGSAAAAIESGDFERALHPGFRDELGELAETIDGMRTRLRDSFSVLESERDRLHRLLERLREGVLTVDPGLTVEYANAAARTMLSADDLGSGDPLPEPWPDFSLRRLAGGLFRPGAEAVNVRVAPDDEHVYSVAGIPAGGEGTAAVVVISDVSERERRERAQREFVTNAAHELRTPLSVISGAVEVLQAGAKEVPEERDRFLTHIERESARLRRLARALLVLARAQTRAEALRLEPVELRPLLEQAAAGARTSDSVAVRVSCPPGLAVLAQPELAEQIVANLVDNARKHTERGEIALTARRAPAGVALEVSDTGAGIAPEERDAIFDRFYRAGGRDRDGFGLGLAIVREAVRALRGTVELESAPGRGTTVRVVLPEAARRAA